MTRICMFAACAPPFYCGGGKQALNLAIKLVQIGHTVTFVTNNIDGSALSEENCQGVHVIRVGMGGKSRNKLFWFLTAAVAYLIRHRHSIDIVHFPSGAFWHIAPILLLADILKKPTLLKLTALHVDDPFTIRHRPLGNRLISMLKRLKRIVAITEVFKQRCLQTGFTAEQVVLIPNGVDAQVYHPCLSPQAKNLLRGQLQLPIKSHLVLFVGGIHASKGVDTLVEAWKRVHIQQPFAQLVLIGPIPNRMSVDNEFLTQIEMMRARGVQIELLPVQNNIEQYYQAADIFTLPSRSEGLPNVTLEAMSTGLPVVVTDISGHHALISDGENGLMVPVDDAPALSQCLLTLMNDPQLAQRLGEEARRTIIKDFSFEIVAKQYNQVYQELLN